jgi:hypothetical protein
VWPVVGLDPPRTALKCSRIRPEESCPLGWRWSPDDWSLPDEVFTGALLGPVTPSSEALVRNHVHEAGVDLQMLGASKDAPEMVEDAAGVPQLGEDLQGVVPHHVGGGCVEVVPVIVDPVLRRGVHCWVLREDVDCSEKL